MPDIVFLGVLTIKYEAIGRQLASDDNADKGKIICQFERAVQTEGGKPESCKNKRQDVDVQNNAMQTMKLSKVLFPIQWSQITITIRITAFFSEPTSIENQSFLSEQFREKMTQRQM